MCFCREAVCQPEASDSRLAKVRQFLRHPQPRTNLVPAGPLLLTSLPGPRLLGVCSLPEVVAYTDYMLLPNTTYLDNVTVNECCEFAFEGLGKGATPVYQVVLLSSVKLITVA